MSDLIKHECGIALIRLLKPLSYYHEKYGTPLYGLNKLYLLMEKEHNRGQDGAGIAAVKIDQKPGYKYFDRKRSISSSAIKDIFDEVFKKSHKMERKNPDLYHNAEWAKQNVPFAGELLLGHLRYGTYGRNDIDSCHPFVRENNWITRTLLVAGNFNMVNNDQLFQQLLELGQHPTQFVDTVTVMEKIGHFLDDEVQKLFDEKKEYHDNKTLSNIIGNDLDIQRILARAAKDFEGGYAMTGLFGHGDAFVLRDPNGIRPVYYYQDDEVVVAASERPAIMTTFNVPFERVNELKPGHALIIKKKGSVKEAQCLQPRERKSCSFERIYFSRGNDKEIYAERKELGRLLTDKVMKSVNYDFEHTIFSFIPNTAETAFYGMMKGLEQYLNNWKIAEIKRLGNKITEEELHRILNMRPRVEKLAHKDVKMRTFITNDSDRSDLVSHVYDITYGQINDSSDSIVLIDDSIVRGTTLKQSIIAILDRLNPKKIIIVSSAPQIRYPDCYGIDMSKMGDFVAFRAMTDLLKEQGKEQLIQDVYEECKTIQALPNNQTYNAVKKLYAQFSDEEISARIAKIVKADHIRAEVEVVYQSVEDLHKACPQNLGDWYFTGDYPTPGGNKVANKAFMNWVEKKDVRAY
ncbi:MAG TPA: amidophosphoribosyltransferase [Chitinophagales bacterium]|nr:amidophosphoribosyltransferase [Chitinophagales bacterium]HNE46072.1 amidophosphoribosyltransferase [Chitinophagales bacterium]HNF68327.1 amidophosphoribosyltransferase [Chitinophagales bacterium]HNK96704.1 amidophosphoribosyltransferase [Chitinophagales bacterium]HNM08137.1 amidophosphoribosyltransferase [Chitinophagales bacterium]